MPSKGLARIKNILYFYVVSEQRAELYDSVRPNTYFYPKLLGGFLINFVLHQYLAGKFNFELY
jgi:hypothetical protein